MHGHEIGIVDVGSFLVSTAPIFLFLLFVAGLPIPIGYWPGKGVKFASFCGGCWGIHVGYRDGDGRWLGDSEPPRSGGGA